MSLKLFLTWVLVLFGTVYCAEIALAEVVPTEIPKDLWNEMIGNLAKSMGVDNFLATYLAVMAGLRILAEGGGIIADKTGTKFDNKIVQWFAKSLNTVSWLAGLFGIGTPKNTRKPELKKG
jgi:hypothetical protein